MCLTNFKQAIFVVLPNISGSVYLFKESSREKMMILAYALQKFQNYDSMLHDILYNYQSEAKSIVLSLLVPETIKF